MQQLELAALRQRRAALAPEPARSPGAPTPPPVTAWPADTVGIALSGGGIRSATFSLGVFQALAQKHLLGAVDFLSTVSGGGYFGGCWGAWLNRLRPDRGGAAGDVKNFADAQRALADPHSAEVAWLRENGRYLTPAGATDAWEAAAVGQRSLAALHFMLGLAVFAGVCLLTGLRWLLVEVADVGGWTFHLGQLWIVHLSPLLKLVPFYAAVVLVYGATYWYRRIRTSATRSHTLTDNLADLLKVIAALVGLALIDSGGLTLCGMAKAYRHDLWTLVTALTAAIGAAFALGLKAKSALEALGAFNGDEKKSAGRSGLLAKLAPAVAAAVLGALWLMTYSFLASALLVALDRALGRTAWFRDDFGADLLPYVVASGPFLVALALAMWFGRHVWFVNLSSLSSLYSARLIRAYLGASNPRRQSDAGRRESEPIADDEVRYADYFPHETGGPLHLVNVTVNQTVDAESNVVQFDRKGMNLAVGPAGLSVGVRHHARWVRAGGDTGPRTGQVVALGATDGEFHVFGEFEPQPDAAGQPVPAKIAVELLPLGHWVGVSGAAFTTGLGARTNRALSFLLCFFNVRLGWWWDSGLQRPDERLGTRTRQDLERRTRKVARRAMRAQTLLFDEMNARFPGTANRFWYLSDGGHFENTAAYELIRRRLPFIVVCDNGCDPARTFDDFADLVRKARIDFDADIAVFTADEIARRVPATLQPYIGTLDELGQIDPATGFSPKPALLAWVHYFDGQTPDSLLLLLKPTVTGREPVDLRNYHAQHGDFPQQTTADQFFDEAQWESYRLLGQWIAGVLFASATPGRPLREAFLTPAAKP